MSEREHPVPSRAEIEDRRLDLLLREVEGGAAPPDLSAQILARHRARPAGPAPAGAAGAAAANGDPDRTARRWLWAAAALLLGVGVTWAVATLTAEEAADRTGQERQLPAPIRVRSAADIDALPAATVSVRGVGLRDPEVLALTRLRRLRHLELRGDDGNRVTAHGLKLLAKLPALESLVLDSLPVTVAGLGHLAAVPRLRELGLAAVEGFGDAHLAQVLKLAGLRRLDLSDNGLLGEGALGRLGELSALRHLAVARITGRTRLRPTGAAVAVEAVTGDGVGVDDRFLGMVARRLTHLRSLDLAGCLNVTGAGLRELLVLGQLRGLDLTRTRLTDRDLQPLLERGGWRCLGLPLAATWSRVRPAPVLALLPAHSPDLVELRLSGAPNMPVDLSALGRLRRLRVLDLDEVAVRPARLAGAVSRVEVLRLRKWPELLLHRPDMPRLREVELIAIYPDSGDYLSSLEHLQSLEVLRIRGMRDSGIRPGQLEALRRRIEVVEVR